MGPDYRETFAFRVHGVCALIYKQANSTFSIASNGFGSFVFVCVCARIGSDFDIPAEQ